MNWTVPGPALLIKSSVYDRIGKYLLGLKAEDREFYLRLLANVDVGFSDEKIACYRLHGYNSSASNTYLDVISDEMAGVNYAAANMFTGVARAYLETFSQELTYQNADELKRVRKKMHRRFKRKLKVLRFFRVI